MGTPIIDRQLPGPDITLEAGKSVELILEAHGSSVQQCVVTLRVANLQGDITDAQYNINVTDPIVYSGRITSNTGPAVPTLTPVPGQPGHFIFSAPD
jgi:hypothetical protein